MFGKGNWAIFGLNPSEVAKFIESIADPGVMLSTSQLWAASHARQNRVNTVGINPFRSPRLDDWFPLQGNEAMDIHTYFESWPLGEDSHPKPSTALTQLPGYAYGEHEFALNDGHTHYGMWLVTNEWKDIADLASMQEQVSYNDYQCPFGFLSSEDKKGVEAECTSATLRKQIPIFLDWAEGRVYINSSSKAAIEAAEELLFTLGVETIPVAWKFPDNGHWPSKLLNTLLTNSDYKDKFIAHAYDAAKAVEEDFEIIDDAEVQHVVEDYFSSTEVEADRWVGISSPAQISLADNGDFVTVKTPTNATSLLQLSGKAKLYSASITIQERLIARTKKGVERTYRNDLFTLDVNDGINMVDVGAAMLRGFDIPGFKKIIKKEIRANNKVPPPIAHFWSEWLRSMAFGVRVMERTFRLVLGVEDATSNGIQPLIAEEGEPALDLIDTNSFTPWEEAVPTEGLLRDRP